MSKLQKISRRKFIKKAGSATLATVSVPLFLPSKIFGSDGNKPPSEKLNIAIIGAGDQGQRNIDSFSSENIAAICDVDHGWARPAFEKCPEAKVYTDFREMFDKEKNIDAVVISTPDHSHAAITMRAIKLGKHVYCEKPLTYSVYEARVVAEAARKAKIATQMGNHFQASEDRRILCEWIWDGAIGKISKVHVWSVKPGRFFAAGIYERPKETPPIPNGLDWDIWIGPAPYRPYHLSYHPGGWRSWRDFGTGALGDMGCHSLDPVFRALKLKSPNSIKATSKKLNKETCSEASIVHYKFEKLWGSGVEVIWYDGGYMPERPDELEEGRTMGDAEGGILFVGDKGIIMTGHMGDSPRLIPEEKMREYKRPAKSIPRSIGHHEEWIEACKGGQEAGSNFDWAGPLTETVQLGNVAIIMDGKELQWDSKKMKITNTEEANEHLHRKYRDGWYL